MEQYINRFKARLKGVIYNCIYGDKASKAYIQIQDKDNKKGYPIKIKKVSKGKQLGWGKKFLKI